MNTNANFQLQQAQYPEWCKHLATEASWFLVSESSSGATSWCSLPALNKASFQAAVLGAVFLFELLTQGGGSTRRSAAELQKAARDRN